MHEVLLQNSLKVGYAPHETQGILGIINKVCEEDPEIRTIRGPQKPKILTAHSLFLNLIFDPDIVSPFIARLVYKTLLVSIVHALLKFFRMCEDLIHASL
jgi:hypothetical protein